MPLREQAGGLGLYPQDSTRHLQFQPHLLFSEGSHPSKPIPLPADEMKSCIYEYGISIVSNIVFIFQRHFRFSRNCLRLPQCSAGQTADVVCVAPPHVKRFGLESANVDRRASGGSWCFGSKVLRGGTELRLPWQYFLHNIQTLVWPSSM